MKCAIVAAGLVEVCSVPAGAWWVGAAVDAALACLAAVRPPAVESSGVALVVKLSGFAARTGVAAPAAARVRPLVREPVARVAGTSSEVIVIPWIGSVGVVTGVTVGVVVGAVVSVGVARAGGTATGVWAGVAADVDTGTGVATVGEGTARVVVVAGGVLVPCFA
jgi:hypothetical protein